MKTFIYTSIERNLFFLRIFSLAELVDFSFEFFFSFLDYFKSETLSSFHYRLHSMLPFDWFLSCREHLHLNFFVFLLDVSSLKLRSKRGMFRSQILPSAVFELESSCAQSAFGERRARERRGIPRLISNVYFPRQTAFFCVHFSIYRQLV
jgi:hypothetical protein